MDSQAITIRAAEPSEVLPFVELAAKYSTTTQTAQDMAKIGESFVICTGGKPVAGMILQRQKTEIFVVAAGGSAGFDLSTAIDCAIYQRAMPEIQSIAFQTKRRGLVAKAIKRGYVIDGYIMRKKII